MTPHCPSPNCQKLCRKEIIRRDGHFYRRSEGRWIQRFKCKNCGKKFSHATGTLEFKQHKRRLNSAVLKLLCSHTSMRRAALNLGVTRRTIERKVRYLARRGELRHNRLLHTLRGRVTHLQFDDMITSEHTKMKPLTITLAVDADRRLILGAQVGRIPAFGLLAKLARKKYGRRRNEHKLGLERLFAQIAPTVAPRARVASDEHKLYPEFVRRHLTQAQHYRHPGGRASIAGYGELKKKSFDPLFCINHTCAMIRDGLARMGRRTWCTTKNKEQLQQQLWMLLEYYNLHYLPQTTLADAR
mgnify:CR=1 FL=1